MPRSGGGVMSWPAGTAAVTNTPISSVAYNMFLADLLADLNAPRPVTAGGTGATSPASAFEALSPMTARGDLLTRDATTSKRLPIGAGGTVLGSDGSDVLWRSGAEIWTGIAQPASETVAGVLEIATEAEAAARTSATLAITPKYNPLPPGFLSGCTLSNNATDALNDLDIAPGKARDSTDATNIILATALTKQLDAAWVAGTDKGGLDTGTVSNVSYHVFLIKRSDTGVVDVLFSTSASSPTMPANYDYRRRIGSILREGGSIVDFRQSANKFWRASPSGDVNATNPGNAAVTRTLKVPIGLAVDAMVIHSVTQGANLTVYGLLSALTDANSAPSATVHDLVLAANADGASNSVSREVTTNASAQIRSRLSASNTGTVETVTTLGWIDTRGAV